MITSNLNNNSWKQNFTYLMSLEAPTISFWLARTALTSSLRIVSTPIWGCPPPPPPAGLPWKQNVEKLKICQMTALYSWFFFQKLWETKKIFKSKHYTANLCWFTLKKTRLIYKIQSQISSSSLTYCSLWRQYQKYELLNKILCDNFFNVKS